MRTIILFLGLICLGLVPLFVQADYVYHIAIMVCIMGIVAISINIVLLMGQLSFAHVAFMAIGAYTSALLSLRLNVPTGVTIFVGAVFASLIAAIIAPLVLKIRGVYFVLLTFSFAQIVNMLLQEWTSLTGGNSGLYGIKRLAVGAFVVENSSSYYLISFAALCVVLFFALYFKKGLLGRIVSCLRTNDELGQSLGVRTLLWRVCIFSVSAFFAGIAGGLYAHYIRFLSPAPFSFHITMDAIVMNVVGGMTSPVGALIGAVIIQPLPEVLRDMREYQLLSYAIILILILLFAPTGVLGIVDRFRKRSRRKI
ncbi:branched-chain amino acid ABC transporter permease [Pusillimonas sp. ANT_WB101]|uniref:branched-chain amino acid ABC transporter permease n=1 Tax=Pusillimonas sp. ANT_WB101 TaxID=2597356 RepID=UPI0011EBCF47|nr:branched-chain amino acid ABC transporter permease [Pusillimonas sp. ANT_WB101]KAA0892638.1 branched-chain amino acid ABC transporter permease [Pusillimonas sp. ANT_WB101]